MRTTGVREDVPTEESAGRRHGVRARTVLAVVSWLVCAAMVAALTVTLSAAADGRTFARQAARLHSQLSAERNRLAEAQQLLAKVEADLALAKEERASLTASLVKKAERSRALASLIKKLEAERAAAAAAAAAAGSSPGSSSGSTQQSEPGSAPAPPAPNPTCTRVWDPDQGVYVCEYQ